MNEIKADVIKIFNKIFNLNVPDLNIQRSAVLKWDSLKHVELIVTLQSHFSIKFEIADVVEIKNLAELAAVVERYKSQNVAC